MNKSRVTITVKTAINAKKSSKKIENSELKKSSKLKNKLFLISGKESLESFLKDENLNSWQLKKIKNLNNGSGFMSFETARGVLGVLKYDQKISDNICDFDSTDYTYFRDNISKWIYRLDEEKDFEVQTLKLSKDALTGFGVGLELFSYGYTENMKINVSVSKEDKKEIQKGLSLGVSINTSRELVDTPPNLLNPKTFKEIIEKEFKNENQFSVKILNSSQLVKNGFGLISGVGQGSVEGPYLVHVTYKSKGAKKSIGAVGKGITFDSGGLDMKPSKFMRWMKKDMGGAASLYGLTHWIKTEKPKVNVDFVFALAENSVSEKSFRPGDILNAQNGKTVEIHNTDAEGRLALASGYNYLKSINKPFDYLFDIATLTGAIKHGLGDRVAGLFTNSSKEGSKLVELSHISGDPLWMMPQPHWTGAQLKSPIADYVNAGAGYGGAISASEFLKNFARPDKKTVWFHLDTYAWTDSARDSFRKKGATGQAVQVLKRWISSIE